MKKALAIIVLFLTALSLFACSVNIDFAITLADKDFIYDGQVKEISVTGEIPQNCSVNYVNNKATNAGQYNVEAKLFGEGYNTKTLKAKMTIAKAELRDITFADKFFDYDGENKTLAISSGLPDGVTVEYENNAAAQVGEYVAKAKINGGNNYLSKELTAKMTIRQPLEKHATPMGNVSFTSKSVEIYVTEADNSHSYTLKINGAVTNENYHGEMYEQSFYQSQKIKVEIFRNADATHSNSLPYLFEQDFTYRQDVEVTYKKSSNDDLVIPNPEGMKNIGLYVANSNTCLTENFAESVDGIRLKRQFLMTLAEGRHIYDLADISNRVRLKINVVANNQPYAERSEAVFDKATQIQAKFIIKYFDSNFVSVEGNNIQTNDYYTVRERLEINSEFLTKLPNGDYTFVLTTSTNEITLKVSVVGEKAPDLFSTGDGSANKPYLLTSATQYGSLKNVEKGKTVKLVNDLTGISQTLDNFMGNLDGNGKSLTLKSGFCKTLSGKLANLNIIIADNGGIDPKIAKINNGEIINCLVEGACSFSVYELSDNKDIALFVNENSGLIENCSSNIKFTITITENYGFKIKLSGFVFVNNGKIKASSAKTTLIKNIPDMSQTIFAEPLIFSATINSIVETSTGEII